MGDTANNMLQIMAGLPQRAVTAMSDQDPGLRSRLKRFELGRIVLEVLAEALPDELFRWTKNGEYVDLSGGTSPDRETREDEHRTFWVSHEGLDSEVLFHERLRFVVTELTHAYQQLDLATLQSRIERLLWLEQVLDTENMVSVYETGYVLGCIPVGHLCVDYFLCEPGYMIAQGCMDVLKAKRDRREATGAVPRPDSEVWYRLYELLAVLKWKGSEAERDRLLTVEEMVDGYLSIEGRCFEFIRTHPVPDAERNSRLIYDLGWCLLQVIKAAMRFAPQRAKQLITHFNEIHGHILEPAPGHFLRFASTQRVDPWYWDFELFKACTSGPVTEDEANLCYQWRLDAMRRQERQDEYLRSFRLGAKNELEIWISQVKAEALPPTEVRRAS